ncbi:hypothetical protein Klosneuvirus_16_2 [Klosneuvirus KNV1]|uniref:Uncharacterized protein n=1 Tax=Klosneuvirus KNV1 TaxID=1977640 RepID=A0A1V0SLT8_9VIRU|nr:hypothetical protein Klosneuvirus_16_2 [Klosneuvirus KNV1]
MTESDKTTKKCTSCEEELELDKFSILNSKKGTRNSQCKNCRNTKRKANKHDRKKEGTKECLECEQELDVKEFSANKSVSDGLQSYCKNCKFGQMQSCMSDFDSFINRLYLDIVHNAKRRAKNIPVEISVDDLRDLYKKQDGKCAYTGKQLTAIRYAVRNDQHIMNKWNVSVDRIDSNKGYTTDNIQMVCAIINRMKTDLREEEFLSLCNDIVKANAHKIKK